MCWYANVQMKQGLYILLMTLSYSCSAQDSYKLNCDFFKNVFDNEDTTHYLFKHSDTTLLFISNKDKKTAKEFYNCNVVDTKLSRIILFYSDSRSTYDSAFRSFKGQKLSANLMTFNDSTHMFINNLVHDWQYEDLLLSKDYRIIKREYKSPEY